MKRIWIGIGILLGLLALGILTMKVTDRQLGEVSAQLRQAAGEPDPQEAIIRARQAKETWENHWFFSAALSDHTNLDQIDALFAQLEVYAQHKDTVSHAAACAWLSEAITDLEENHRLTWWNLL